MKRIFIDMEKLKNLNSGLGQFCLNIGNELSKQDHSKFDISFYLPEHLRNHFGKKFNYISSSFLHKVFPVSSSSFDVWHCLHQDSHYIPSNPSCKLILTVHDLNYLQKHQSGIKRQYYLKRLQKKIDRASAITVISKYTESQIREQFSIPNIPVRVIYNGNSLTVHPNAVKPDFIHTEEFIFSIGIISPKKNFHVLLNLLEKLENISLVIAGANNHPYAKEIMRIAGEKGLKNKVLLTGKVDNETKYWLLKNCKAFVFPSLAEGFGLPVIEAMSLGKPVFLSASSSLPEIGGMEAFYWKDFESEHMFEIFEKSMKDFRADPDKSRRIKKWAEKFSWETATKQYLQLYEEL